MQKAWELCFDNPANAQGFYHSGNDSNVHDLSTGTCEGEGFIRCILTGEQWNDPNHKHRAWMNLIFQSWFAKLEWPYCDPGAPGGKLGYPAVNDLRGAEWRITARAKDLSLPLDAKIVLLAATHVKSQQHWPNPDTQRSIVNALQVVDIVSNGLQFGNEGYHGQNAVFGVHDSGWREIAVRFSTNPADWLLLGGVKGRQGLSNEPLRYYNYIAANPDEFLADFTGSLYLVVAYPPGDAPAERATGELWIRDVSLWVPTAPEQPQGE